MYHVWENDVKRMYVAANSVFKTVCTCTCRLKRLLNNRCLFAGLLNSALRLVTFLTCINGTVPQA